MATLVSWELYSSLHNKVKQDEFDKAELLAEKEVKNVIGAIRWANITPDSFGYDVLQDCICNVIDLMKDNEKLLARIGVSSVSNDGYSESYGSDITETSINDNLKASIKGWLSGTGLVGAY